nr:HI1506-related protein [uncultured Pseudomonas sp.]
MNGVTITAKIDGFRRGGIAHSAVGTHYPEGYFSEAQLEAFRQEPQLVVVEGVIEVSSEELSLIAADQQHELLSNMVDSLKGRLVVSEELVEVLTGRLADSEDVVQALLQCLTEVSAKYIAIPELILLDLRSLERADPAKEGVLCLKEEDVLGLLKRFTLAHPLTLEHGNAGTTTAGDAAGTSEATADAAAAAPGPQAPAAEALPVTDQKPAGGKAARGKASKDAGKQEGDNA